MLSLNLFSEVDPEVPHDRVESTEEIDRLLAAGAPVAIGVSGGKDSTAVSFATIEHLDRIGHRGPRLLVHADLGVTEWAESLPQCQRLADRLGIELMVARRPQGDMMDRWEQRWRDNVRRWETLSCVKLIMPWSSKEWRFCTSEMKVDQITRALSRRFPGETIINVTGIRRQESDDRAKALIAKPCKKLTSIERDTDGWDWNPILEWTIDDVWAIHDRYGLLPHEGYTKYGMSRISCIWCILATLADHLAAMKVAAHHPLGRRMVALEAVSTFAFQGSRWLGDTLAPIIDQDLAARLEKAKVNAEARELAEAKIPDHLLYTKGWPTCVPTLAEARLLGAVRFAVADAVGLRPTFIKAGEIINRYEQLMADKERKGRKPRKRKAAIG